jgi:hypothetical protein
MISRQPIQKALERLANVSDVEILGDFAALLMQSLHAEHMDLVLIEIHVTKPHTNQGHYFAKFRKSHETVIKC